MWTVVFPGRLYEDLRRLLFSTAPRENGCFLLARHYRTRGSCALLVSGIEAPGAGSWNRAGRRVLEPSSTFINRAAVRADAGGYSLIFVHAHPGARRASFSSVDKKSNTRLLENLHHILPGRPLGSLVFGTDCACGVVHDGGPGLETVNRIRVAGNMLDELAGSRKNGRQDRFDRQVRVLGGPAHARLQDMTIAVVGAGGTGSAVAVQLARMGVDRIRLVDRDMLDESNLPRVYGAAAADVGRCKAEVVGDHISAFSGCAVETVCSDVSNAGVRHVLASSDVIFGCTDNLTSRSVINEISSRYLVPFIDVGCRILLDPDGGVRQAVAKVQTVTPDGPCLWCTEALDGKTILQESFSAEERARLVGEGYADDVTRQPSIVSLTTMAASMAVNQLLGLLGVFGKDHATRMQVEIRDGFEVADSPRAKDSCVCAAFRGVPFPEAL